MTRLFRHIRDAIHFENAESLELIFDRDRPILSTGDMRTWFTGKPCGPARRSHINFSVHDSGWEAEATFALDQMPGIAAWVKNDHLGFEVYYVDGGTVRKYRPDYLVRFLSGDLLVLEIKGQEDEQDKSKHRYLSEWVKAVNLHGGFGHWRFDVSRSPSETRDILAKYSRRSEA